MKLKESMKYLYFKNPYCIAGQFKINRWRQTCFKT